MTARFSRSTRILLLVPAGLLAAMAAYAASDGADLVPGRWRQHDIRRPRPAAVEPAIGSDPTPAPKDAVVLLGAGGLGAWRTPEGGKPGWKFSDGVLQTVPGAGPIVTTESFGDVQLHVEWSAPAPPVGVGQDRGNSGVFLMGQFEVQVLDSYRAETYADGMAGSIYGQYPPLFNASRPPGQWQSYDIAFRRPRFDREGKLLAPARLTVFHNGILVQNNEELWGQTNWLESQPFDPGVDRGPIQLQDHNHPVRYRNIWLRKLPERSAPPADDQGHPAVVSLPAEALDALAGRYAAGPEPHASRFILTREGDHLRLKLPSRPTALLLQPISATEFVLPHTDARLTFRKDEEGHISVVFRVGDAERTLKRTGR
jgi:hypothetical protein